MKITTLIVLTGIASAEVFAQTPPPPATAKPPVRAAPKPSRVDEVIQLVKGGMTDSTIVKVLQKTNKPIDLSTTDLLKLKSAGVSENVISVMMDPAAAAAPAPVAPVAAEQPPPPPPPPMVEQPAPAPVAATPPPAPSAQSLKKRVVVDPFDYSAVMTSVQAVFGTQQNIGAGIRALMTTRLQKADKLVVLDRSKLKEVLNEQDQTLGTRFKQGKGAKIGGIIGADVILAGDITIFGRDDKKKGVNLGGVGGQYGRVFGGLSALNKEEKAVVAINYRLIDAETTEVIASGEARGESVRKSKNFGAALAAYGTGGGGGAVDMTSSNFAETIIGEATQDCVNKLAEILNTQAETMKRRVREVEAYVANVAGSTMTITAGADDGVNVGEVFEILHIDSDVRDPVTKEVLDRNTTKVGEMTIYTVRPKIATGPYSGPAIPAGSKDYLARKRM